MFREMRRNTQLLPREEAEDILKNGTSGILAVAGDDGYPYAVPLSYVYQDGKIWFHCAKVGHKIDAITAWDKVSFCVIGQDKVVPERYTTHYRSVIAFGRARVLEGEEKAPALEALGERYNPGDGEGLQAELAQNLERVCVVEIAIEHLTGKEAVELARQRQN